MQKQLLHTRINPFLLRVDWHQVAKK